MKALRYIASFLVLAALVSCSVKEEFQPGPQDWADSQLFYFPTQEHLGSNELEPTDDTFFTFTAMRKDKSARKVFTPVVTDTSEAQIFKVDPIVFEKGQTSTTFKVHFDGAKIGINYAVSLSVDGPQNVSYYTALPTTLSFEVIRVQWNYLGKAKMRDDFVSSIWVIPNKYSEGEVDIYERADLPGYYRFPDFFPVKLIAALFGRSEEAAESYHVAGSTVDIDATDPTKVKMKPQHLGVSVNGFEQIGSSYSPEYWVNGDSYGTLTDGVLTFPKQGLAIEYQSGSVTYANGNGMFRLVLPGYSAVDYDVKVESNHSDAAGNLTLNLTLGADVKKFVYQVFEGRLNDVEASEKAIVIADGSLPGCKTLNSSGRIRLSFDKTGLYTLVGVGLDKNGEVQTTVSKPFGYIAAGEEYPIKLSMGLTANDKYAKSGNTAENSVQYYISGEEIETLYYGLYDRADIDADIDAIVAELTDPDAENEVPDTTLAKVNDAMIEGIFTGLAPGTEYVLLAVADNGFVQETLTTSVYTSGEPNNVYRKYSSRNVKTASSTTAYDGTYNYYAKDRLNVDEDLRPIGDPQRCYQGQATLVYDPEEEVVWAKGLFPRATKTLGIDNDAVWFDYLSGNIMCHYEQMMEEFEDGGFTMYPRLGVYEAGMEDRYASTGNIMSLLAYSENDQLIIGGFVADGVIAFVSRYSNYQFDGFAFMTYFDQLGNTYDDTYAIYTNLLLVDPEKDDSGLAPAATPAPAPAAAATRRPAPFRVRKNSVETQQGHAESIFEEACKHFVIYPEATGVKMSAPERKVASFRAEVLPAAETVESVEIRLQEHLRPIR